MKEKLLLLAVIILGLFLRVYDIGSFPVGLHIDEAEVGYNAYSLALTGKDELGNFLPTHLNIFGFSRPEQIFYITAPFVKLFSLSEASTRIPTALFGVGTILLVYFLSKEIFNKKSIAIIVALLLSITPWHIIFSRATSEGIIEVFWLTYTIYLLLKFIKKKKWWYLIVAYVTGVLTMYAYLPSRLLLPLLLIVFMIVFSKELLKSKKIAAYFAVFLGIFVFFPTVFLLQDKTGLARFNQVSIFSSAQTQLLLEEEIREDSDSSNRIITRVIHNKPLKYIQTFLQNYQEYFTLSFLSLKGGLPSRFVIPNTGGLYLVSIPFLVLGLYASISQRKKEYLYIVIWFFVAPVTSAITFEDSPNIQRSMNMVIPAALLTSFGIHTAYEMVKRNYRQLFIVSLLAIFFISLLYFCHQYFVHQKVHRPWDRMVEMKEYVSYLNSVEKDYPLIISTKATTELYIYLLFYNKINPAIYHKSTHLLNDKGVWQMGKYRFINNDCATVLETPIESNILYIDRFTCPIHPEKKYIREIKRPDNTLALRVYTIPNPKKFKQVILEQEK